MSINQTSEEIRKLALTMTRELGRRVTKGELRLRVNAGTEVEPIIEGLIDIGIVARDRDGFGPGAERFENQLQNLAQRAERWVKRITGTSGHELTEAEAIQLHIEKVERSAEKELAGARGHTVSFLGVNAMLFVIWAITGAGFPWFLIPLMGWGIGYITHRVEVKSRVEENRQVQEMKRPNLRKLELHHRLWKKRRGFRGHLASNIGVAILLGTINIITGGGFPWALIPIAGMGVGVFAHYGAWYNERRKLLAQLEDASSQAGPMLRAPHAPNQTLPAAAQAAELRDLIVEQIESLPVESAMFDSDFHRNLNAYVDQVTRLSNTRDELVAALSLIPIDNLDNDRAGLVSRRAEAPNTRLQAEYDKSIEQIDRQKQSYLELKSEQEMVDLKIGNAVNALRQLQIDVTRMKSMTPAEGEEVLENLRARTGDLSTYLNDLREGYEEIE